MTVIPLLPPRIHRLRKRLRDLEALRRRVDEEIAVVRGQVFGAGNAFAVDCGTERGYQWHRFNDRENWPLPKHDPCGCRAAHRLHARARKAQEGAA